MVAGNDIVECTVNLNSIWKGKKKRSHKIVSNEFTMWNFKISSNIY